MLLRDCRDLRYPLRLWRERPRFPDIPVRNDFLTRFHACVADWRKPPTARGLPPGSRLPDFRRSCAARPATTAHSLRSRSRSPGHLAVSPFRPTLLGPGKKLPPCCGVWRRPGVRVSSRGAGGGNWRSGSRRHPAWGMDPRIIVAGVPLANRSKARYPLHPADASVSHANATAKGPSPGDDPAGGAIQHSIEKKSALSGNPRAIASNPPVRVVPGAAGQVSSDQMNRFRPCHAFPEAFFTHPPDNLTRGIG